MTTDNKQATVGGGYVVLAALSALLVCAKCMGLGFPWVVAFIPVALPILLLALTAVAVIPVAGFVRLLSKL